MQNNSLNPIQYNKFLLLLSQALQTSETQPQPDNYYNRALYAQFCFETGNGSSRIFFEFNNLYGMRPARKRKKFYSTEVNTANGLFAKYNTPVASIADRLDLDAYNNITYPNSLDAVAKYYKQINDKGYTPEEDYPFLLMSRYNSVFTDEKITINKGFQDSELDDLKFNEVPLSESFKLFNMNTVYIFLGITAFGFFLYKKYKK